MKRIVLIISMFLVIILLMNNKSIEEIKIPNESIRIRIIANSNSKEDQEIKKVVKRAVQNELSGMLKEATTIDEVRDILNNNLGDIEYTVSKTLQRDKNSTNFDVDFGNNYFPKKVYKGVNYDSGFYESIVISLGESKGDNWWCVLFPPLCLMDEEEENIDKVEYKSFVKEVIDKYFLNK